MATPEPEPTVPKAFISYSWDDDAHREWVKQLAIRLRADGVDVTLDRWHAAPGDQIPAFMERAVRENDFVIAVCTPRFKEKSDGRGGGVGYEGDIMTAYAFTGGDKRKFIPVLRRGSWDEAAPTWLLGRAKIDLSGDPYSESEYEELLRTLHGAREEAPPIGPRPNFGDKKGSQASPAPAPVTPLAGSSTPQHQSSVTPTRNATGGRVVVGPESSRRNRPNRTVNPPAAGAPSQGPPGPIGSTGSTHGRQTKNPSDLARALKVKEIPGDRARTCDAIIDRLLDRRHVDPSSRSHDPRLCDQEETRRGRGPRELHGPDPAVSFLAAARCDCLQTPQ